MLKVITKEIPIDEELKTRIQFICDFCNTTPTFINGSIRKVEKTNIVILFFNLFLSLVYFYYILIYNKIVK